MRRHISILIALLLAAIVQAHAAYTAVVAFGDSLSDYGNAGVFTNTTAAKPSSQIVGVWVKQLATRMNLPLEPSKKGGTDYAIGGATTVSMSSQVKTYLTANPAASPTAVYTIFCGSNDLMFYATKHPTDSAGLLDTSTKAVNNIKSQIGQIATAGGRTFIWLNMFPINKTPLIAKGAPFLAPLFSAPIDQFNTAWAAAIQDLRTQFPNCTFVGMDFYGKTNDMLAHPEQYGLLNLTTPCKGQDVNADTYMFWDPLHPTTRVHQILADFAYSLLLSGETAKPSL